MHVKDNASKVRSRACLEPMHPFIYPLLLLLLLLIVLKRSLRDP